MKEMSLNELREVNGGAHIGIAFAIAAGVTFLIGVIDGFVRPLKCN